MRDLWARLALPAACLALAGCGGERQDAEAPSGTFALDVTRAEFPARQAVGAGAVLRLEVANRGDEPVPDVAVTLTTAPEDGEAPVAFGQRSGDAALADAAQPVWLLDRGPAGGASAYVNTWALGTLAAGAAAEAEWRVTPVRAGRYTLAWSVAPALVGDVELDGGRTRGEFDVVIGDEPVPARVGDDGAVVRGG